MQKYVTTSYLSLIRYHCFPSTFVIAYCNLQALGALRQKMKKYVRDFENNMANYREVTYQ